MTTETPELLNAIAETNRLVEILNEAFKSQEWEQVETLIRSRDLAAAKALPPEIPEALQQLASEMINNIREQNRQLSEHAKQHLYETGEELMQRRKQKKNIEAYKLKK